MLESKRTRQEKKRAREQENKGKRENDAVSIACNVYTVHYHMAPLYHSAITNTTKCEERRHKSEWETKKEKKNRIKRHSKTQNYLTLHAYTAVQYKMHIQHLTHRQW